MLLAACAGSNSSSADDDPRAPGDRTVGRSIAAAPAFVETFDPSQERPLADEPAAAHGFTGQEEDAPRCQVAFFNETRWKVRIYLEKRYLGTVFPLATEEITLSSGERDVTAWADPDHDASREATQWKRVFSCRPKEQARWYLYEPDN